MMAIVRLENTMIKVIKETRRWERHNGQLMRKHKGEWHPVSRRDEEELREILHQIIEKIDRLLTVFFGEEPIIRNFTRD